MINYLFVLISFNSHEFALNSHEFALPNSLLLFLDAKTSQHGIFQLDKILDCHFHRMIKTA